MTRDMASRNVVSLAVALWLGLALGTHCGVVVATLGLAPGIVLLLAPRGRDVALATAFFLLGLARGGAGAARDDAALARFPRDGAFVRLLAIVAEPPRLAGDHPACVL